MTSSALAAEIREASRNPQHAKDRQAQALAYERWCADHALRAFPLEEQVLLRWLHSHYPDWSWSYAKTYAGRLDRVARERGYPHQDLPRMRRYLQALKRDLGAAKLAKVDGMTAQEFVALARTLMEPAAPLSGDRLRLRGAAATRWITGLPLVLPGRTVQGTSVKALPSDAFRRDASGQVTAIEIDGREVRLDPERAGRLPAFIAQALDATPGRERPFDVREISRRVRQQFERAAHRDCADWHEWNLESIEWALDAFDPGLEWRYRDACALLVGVCLARRFQDIREIRLEDIWFLDDGADIRQPFSKTDQTGRGTRKHLPHAVPGKACSHGMPCAALCPVQALRDYCDYQRIVRQRTKGSIVQSLYAGRHRPMTTKGWNHVLAYAWTRAGLPDDRRISSRSMRVTGATLAKRAGATIEQVQALTDHRDPRSVQVYLRKHDSEGTHIVLLDEGTGDS